MIENYLNLNASFRPALFDPRTLRPLSYAGLSQVLPPGLAELELCRDSVVPIPRRVLEIYDSYRPTPLSRARQLEKEIGTTCRLYFKNEGNPITGSHKLNSACLIAELCKQDGVETVTTETTGNWGIALAVAGMRCGLRVVCFIDSDSHEKRPDRKPAMEAAGAEVVVVEHDSRHHDLLTLSADAAIEATRAMKSARYIFGSVYNYFVTPQTIVGLEAKDYLAQMGEYPDIVVGCCGGGANLLGTAGAFVTDRLAGRTRVDFFSAESENCPILTGGRLGKYSVDTLGCFPKVETLGLPDGLLSDEYIGGLGSTIVAPPVAEMYRRGILRAATYSSREARTAHRLFHETEGRWLALESAYTVAAVLVLAKAKKGLRILANISVCESDRTLL